jgi:hypothetical protein
MSKNEKEEFWIFKKNGKKIFQGTSKKPTKIGPEFCNNKIILPAAPIETF